MLEDANLPTYFWAKAINTACYTQNCSLINKHGKTPYEMVKGKKPRCETSSCIWMQMLCSAELILNSLGSLIQKLMKEILLDIHQEEHTRFLI